ncbi:hypothetical protein ACUODF_30745, partial [Escherichia coli]
VPAANVPKKAPEGMQIFGVKKLSDARSRVSSKPIMICSSSTWLQARWIR